MPVEVHPPPPAHLSSRQLPLPLVLPGAPPPAPLPAPDVVLPPQVWPRLARPAQVHVRQTFVRVLREVLHDGAER